MSVTDVTYQRAREGWRERFIEALSQRPNVAYACRVAGVSRNHAYRVRNSDPAFAEQWDDVKEASLDDIEESVHVMARTDIKAAQLLLTAYRPQFRQRKDIPADPAIQAIAAMLGQPVEEVQRQFNAVVADLDSGRLRIGGPEPIEGETPHES